MNRLSLTLPADSSARLAVIARALHGLHPVAVALSACGWHDKLKPQAYVREKSTDGAKLDSLTWFVEADTGRAHDLANRWDLPPNHAKALPLDHPFAAAMRGLEQWAALHAWLHSSHSSPWTFCTQTGQQPVVGVVPIVAAAAMAVGFQCHYEVRTGSDGQPLIYFPERCFTQPDLTIHDIMWVSLPREVSRVTAARKLPGYPPEEHPYFYALQALINMRVLLGAVRSARDNPIIAYKSDYSERTALVTASAMREGRRDTADFRDRLHKFLELSD